MSVELLVYLPVEKWETLKSTFKSDWPRGLPGYILFDYQKDILEDGIDYGFKIYCPYGDTSNGMVALNIKGTFHEVVIQSVNNDTEKLLNALKTTKLIDWKHGVHVPFAPHHIMDCVRKLIQDTKSEITLNVVTEAFCLDINKPLFDDVQLPVGCTFKLLSLDHVELVDSKWPHRYPGSTWYYELLIRAKLGYGLFQGSELISWVFVRETGALGHLYTLEDHRRKGYGELVLKLISNVLLQKGRYVVAHCVKGNDGASKLYKKLGFESTGDLEWTTFKS